MEEVASAKQHWAIESGTVNSVLADRGVREFGEGRDRDSPANGTSASIARLMSGA